MFHKIIIQSGVATNTGILEESTLYKTLKLMKLLGADDISDPGKIMKILRDPSMDPYEFNKYIMPLLSAYERRCSTLKFSMKPVLEPPSNDAVVTTNPHVVFKDFDKIQIPIMMGYNSAESLGFPAALKKDLKNFDYAKLIPIDLKVPLDTSKFKAIVEEVKKFYFNGQELDENLIQELADAISDNVIISGLVYAAEMISRFQPNAPLYFCRFDYNGDQGFYKSASQLPQVKGACHGDDLFYLFQSTTMQSFPFDENLPDTKMIRKMCKMWSNFAKHGNPTPNKSHLGFIWDAVEKVGISDDFNLRCMNISSECRMIEYPEKKRMDFWRQIYQKYSQDYVKHKL